MSQPGPTSPAQPPTQTPGLSDEKARELGLEPGICTSCGARVLWAKTINGAAHPLQPRQLRVYAPRLSEQGKPDGTGICVNRLAFESHFADCPNAGQHRSKR